MLPCYTFLSAAAAAERSFMINSLINSFFSLLNNSDLLNFFGMLIVFGLGYFFDKRPVDFSEYKSRHEKLYAPLFLTLEPALYKTLDQNVLSKALEIISSNLSIVDGKLLEIYRDCAMEPSPESFRELCKYADQAFDQSCKNIRLKQRSISYRLNNKQYKNKFVLIFLVLRDVIAAVLVVIIYFYSVLIGIALILSWLSMDSIPFTFRLASILGIIFLVIRLTDLKK